MRRSAPGRLYGMLVFFLALWIGSWTPRVAGSKESYHRRRDLAIEASPSGGYEPIKKKKKDLLSDKETDYIMQKAGKSSQLWETYLTSVGLADFDIANFTARSRPPVPGETLPNIGIAMSGGGIRALIGGAGILDAFDNRNPLAVRAGTAGILQLSNYITGLSGGSWLVGSWATSNFPTFTDLNQTVWRLTESSGYASWSSVKRYPQAISQAHKKSNVQAYILSRHLINDTHHGSKVLFSSIKNTTAYKNHEAPFPILLCTSRVNGISKITHDSPIYEFNPEEFGVCHPTLKAYIPLEDLGSRMIAGKPAGEKACVQGFDNAGFVIGASSNVLSQPGFAKFSWGNILPEAYDRITNHIYDEAIVPNPFYGMGQSVLNGTGYPEEASQNLYLADGGWGGEILPLWPLLQPERKMDVIIAIDFSADGPSMFHGAYPNGTSLFNTYQKTQEEAYKNIPFPEIPDPHGPFSQKGLNKRPSFFGCNENHGPIIIYFPNYFVVANTNQATMKTDYTEGEINAFFKNSFGIATQTKPEEDVSSFESDVESVETILGRAGPISHTAWKQCLACALIDRQLARDNIPRSPQCQRCFAEYCA